MRKDNETGRGLQKNHTNRTKGSDNIVFFMAKKTSKFRDFFEIFYPKSEIRPKKSIIIQGGKRH